MRSTDHPESLFTPLNLSRSNGVFASVSLPNQPYKLLPWRCIFEPPICHTSLSSSIPRRFVFIPASWPLADLPFKLQAPCPASPSRGPAHRNHQKEFVLPHLSVRRVPSNLRTRMGTTTSCRALEMYIIRTSPVPDNAKDIRSTNPQESKHSPRCLLSPFLITPGPL